MTYAQRIDHLNKEISAIIADLQSNFYFAEADQMHQPLTGGWSAVEELEYANLRNYDFMRLLQNTERKTKTPNLTKAHRLRFFAKYTLKREQQRANDSSLPDSFLPVSRRKNVEKVRIKEQKVFTDLLDVLEMWKKMLDAGKEREDLTQVKLRGGLLNLFTLDALELAVISLSIIRAQMDIAKQAVKR
ncbi:MAG: hypothetical protein LAT54_09600 [Cryomorphaceae bacterium]|nr:hypothetical protein [Cryomorphaceae bacterium]